MNFFLGILTKSGITMDSEENKDARMRKVPCCGFGKELVRY